MGFGKNIYIDFCITIAIRPIYFYKPIILFCVCVYLLFSPHSALTSAQEVSYKLNFLYILVLLLYVGFRAFYYLLKRRRSLIVYSS